MSKSANVLSVQTLKDFKLAMITFAEDARNSLSGVDMELRRIATGSSATSSAIGSLRSRDVRKT